MATRAKMMVEIEVTEVKRKMGAEVDALKGRIYGLYLRLKDGTTKEGKRIGDAICFDPDCDGSCGIDEHPYKKVEP